MENITIKGTTGTSEGMTLINAFKIADLNSRFVLLTKFEQVGDGVNKIYISEFVENNPGVLSLVGIKDDTLWDKVKNVMKQIVEKTSNIKVYNEIENVKKCSIEATTDFDNSRKIIGVKSSSITVDDSGFCPLGRIDSFTEEEQPVEMEEISALDALSTVSETMDFDTPTIPTFDIPASTEPSVEPIPNPMEPVNQVETPKFVIPEAVVNDTITASPVDVAPTDALETMIPDTPAEPEVEVPEVEEPIALDIQMPVMDEEVKAEEPTGIDDSLFTTAKEEQLEVKLPTESVEDKNSNPVDNSKIQEEVNKKLEELKNALYKHIEEDLNQYKAEIEKILNPNVKDEIALEPTEEKKEVESVKTLEENVMNDALSQIQNMIIPE